MREEHRDDFDQEETTTMTDPTIPVTEDELHAFVDNELPAERRGDVEAWLAAHPEDAERVQGILTEWLKERGLTLSEYMRRAVEAAITAEESGGDSARSGMRIIDFIPSVLIPIPSPPTL